MTRLLSRCVWLLCAGLLSSATLPADDDLAPKALPPTFYHAHGNVLYHLDMTPGNNDRLPTAAVVTLDLDGRQTGRYVYFNTVEKGVLRRWHVTADAFWYAGDKGGAVAEATRIPLDELRYHDKSDPDGLKKLRKKYDLPDNRVWDVHRWKVGPANWAGMGQGVGLANPKDFVNYDLLPRGKDRCLLFVQERTEMVVWEGKAEPPEPGSGSVWVEYKPVERFEAGFRDQFTVLPHGDDYLFLTTAGHLYLADRSAGGFRTARPVWRSAKHPLRLGVVDVDSGAVGLFPLAPDGLALSGVPYFLLAKGKVTQRFFPPSAEGFADGARDHKLALALLREIVRPAK